jgi:membrane protein required for colicin V production
MPLNQFDAAIYLITLIAVVFGFNAGLLRSLATIFGYVAAAPVAVGTAPALSLFLVEKFRMPAAYNGAVLFGVLLVCGMAFSALLRRAVGDLVGPNISLVDRLCGAVLGAVRIALLAVAMVVIFDRIIPANREPGFLKDSHLRPYLSAAGQKGLRSLPPDVTDYIDRLKRARGI